MEELNNKLKTLHNSKDWQSAVDVVGSICDVFGIEISDEPFLFQHPKINAHISWFMNAPGFINRPASYEINHNNRINFDIKLYWGAKVSKTILSWMVGITPNFEDAKTFESDKYKIGLDIVIPKECDRVILLVSNKYKVRSFELKEKLSRTDREIIEKLQVLSTKQTNSIEEKRIFHNILWDAFNFEPINRKFYKELVDRFTVLRDHLVNSGFNNQDAVMFSTRLIGRILFTWFLRKKNLINEKVAYFDASNTNNQTSYYREKLEKLFFETLNTEIIERGFDDVITPYLNGGLFESSRTDFCNERKLTIPNGYFSKFFEVLSHYNFTVDESSPEFEQVAIDPEMLGRIFESLLAEQRTETGEQARKAKGAFYTPREIVQYMCEESLKEYLKTKIEDDVYRDVRIEEVVSMSESIFRDQDHNKRRDWKPYSQSMIKALDELTILDPAVGSGAYPMGMLHLLVKVYTRLDSKYEKNLSKLKRSILSRSLFGSDIDITAIEICRLRAWLSLIVDLEEDEQVVPLPNLEFHFVCANTLISLNRQPALEDTMDLRERMKKIREDYYNTNSKNLKETLRKRYEKLLNPSQASLLSENDNILKTYEPFSHEGKASFFDPDLMFGVSKFDIVIGNPPYVQLQKFKGQKIQKDLEDQKYLTFEKTGDMYALFYEKGLSLTKKETGLLCYITSNKWMRAGYGEKLRLLFIQNNPLILLDLGGNIFESATVDSNILLIKNTKNKGETTAFTVKNNKEDFYSKIKDSSVVLKFESSREWFIGDNTELKLKEKIEKIGVQLKDLSIKINYGIKTGYNDAFVIDEETKDKLKINDQRLDDIILPLLLGKEVNRYYSDQIKRKYILLISDRVEIEKYPTLMSHLKKFEGPLKKRAQYIRGDHEWLTVDNCPSEAVIESFRKPKIIWGNISYDNCFSYSESGEVVTAPGNILITSKEDIKYLLGCMNSSIFNWEFKQTGIFLGKAYEWKKQYVEKIHIPKITTENKKIAEQVVEKVEEILAKKKNNAETNTIAIENDINELVMDLYELTDQEKEVIRKA